MLFMPIPMEYACVRDMNAPLRAMAITCRACMPERSLEFPSSVGIPEKVNAVAVADAGKVGNSTRKTRDLVFDDEEETEHPVVAGSTADTTKGETISVKATIELTRDGKLSTVLPTESFKSGDKVRLLFSTNRDGNVYWVAKGTSGQYQVLFPSPKAGMNNTVDKNKQLYGSGKGCVAFLMSRRELKRWSAFFHPPVCQNSIRQWHSEVRGRKMKLQKLFLPSSIVTKASEPREILYLRKKIIQDVNTKTQTSSDNEPFVATYELIHN